VAPPTGRDRAEPPFDPLPERVHSPPQRDAFVDALRQRYGLGVLGAYLGGCDDGSVAP
jgi:hypothetical protein